ncbi:uncharacterized protein LOC122806570 isoform X1 [Protopterus annectens]|uniref:uncharacterized protein LOC122806570 isoform X1 n=1 Tax=Protopterus annectens TaxID=7888 RepID=UPI001CFA5249|nr:uncharacterized protein LOC122806570 isoform X1 [Protopterus annectens]
MDTLPLCILILTGSVTTSAEIAVQGIEGESLLINWTYPRGYESYTKYFVRGEYSTATLDKLVEINEGKSDHNVTKGKYSLYDYKSAVLLTATINTLSSDDSGSYHFGITELGRDTHMNVHVSVIKAQTTGSPLNTLSTCTDTENESYTTSHTDVLSPSMNMPQSSQTPNDMIPSKIRKAEIPVIVIAASAVALVFVLLLIIGIYYAKMKKKKAVSSPGGRTKTIKNTFNGAAQVSEQNIDMVPYSDISFAEVNNPVYANSEEATNYSTDKCRKKEQRPSTTYATVKCDKEEHRPSITYAEVDFADCGKKSNVLASTSEDPSLYSTLNC